MRFLPMRFHDRKLDEEQGQHREHHCLNEAHEHLEGDQRQRQQVRDEEHCHDDHHFPRKHVSEETEGERDEPAYVRD